MSGTLSVQALVIYEKEKEPKTGCLEVKDMRLTWTPDTAASSPMVFHIVHDIRDIEMNKKHATDKQKAKAKIHLVKNTAIFSWVIIFNDFGDRDAVIRRLYDIRKQAAAERGQAGNAKEFQPEVPLPGTAAKRAAALSNNPQLLDLHNQFVKSGIMTEDEFWQNPERKHLLQSTGDVMVAQPTGMRSHYFTADLQKTRTSNQITYSLTAQNINDIFRELPHVKKTFMDNVPEKMSEEQFWKNFFQSRHFNRQEKRKDDLFAEVDPPVEVQPTGTVITDPSLDLRVAEEVPVGYGLKDYEKPLAPLGNLKPVKSPSSHVIEQFNRHSGIVLQAAANATQTKASPSPALSSVSSPAVPSPPFAGSQPPASKQGVDSMSDIVARHALLDDLEEIEGPVGIPLRVQDRSRYFEGPGGSTDNGFQSIGIRMDEATAKTKMLDALRDLLSTAAPLKAETQDTAHIQPPLFTKLMEENTCTRARNVLEDLICSANQGMGRGSSAAGAKNAAQEAAKVECEAQLDGHANKVIEVLRYFWSISLMPGLSTEEQEKIARLRGCMEELQQSLTKAVSDLPASLTDTHKARFEALQQCLTIALERAKQDQWDLRAQVGANRKRPASTLEGPRASVVMKMKPRRTAVT